MSTPVTLGSAVASLPTAASDTLQPGTVADAGDTPLETTSDETSAGVQLASLGGEQDFAAQTYSLRATLLQSELNAAVATESSAKAGKGSAADASDGEAALVAAAVQRGAKRAGKATAPALEQLPNVPVKVNHIAGLERGPLKDVNAIVLHRTAGSNLDLNTPATSRLGTHYYIAKNGDIYQTASLDKYTAHVGKIRSKCIEEPGTCSAEELKAAQKVKGVAALDRFEQKKAYGDRYPTNKDSVGIEVVAAYNERTKTWDAPTAAQQKSIDTLVDALQTRYNLTASDIYQHDKISYKTAGEGAGLGH